MYVYRLCKASFKALDGEGARINGGRWNSPGRAVVYTSTTLSLAVLELLIHVDPAQIPVDLVALTIEVPDAVPIQALDTSTLPAGWDAVVGAPECRAMGDAWIALGSPAALRVPAAPIPEEFNVLLNPLHTDARRIAIISERPFTYDPRLLG